MPKIKKIRKIKKKYPEAQCMHIDTSGEQCTKKAVGKSTLCKKHGGKVIIKENLLARYDPVESPLYKPDYHPMAFNTLSRDGLSPVEKAAEYSI